MTATVRIPTEQARCDRCGAKATTLAVLVNGQELMFCGHHANEHRFTLTERKAILLESEEKERH